MGESKRFRKVRVAVALAGMLCALVYVHYWIVKPATPGLMSDFSLWMFAAISFVIGTMARMAFNTLFLEQDLRISPDVLRFEGKPHVALSNMLLDDLIEVKLSFELFEKRDEKGASFAGRLRHAETVSLASVPARRLKTGCGKVYVEIPSKLLETWNSDLHHRVMLYVRATSVQPTTNFRSLTNTAEFNRVSVFGDEPQGLGSSDLHADVNATDLARAEKALG